MGVDILEEKSIYVKRKRAAINTVLEREVSAPDTEEGACENGAKMIDLTVVR